MFLTTEDLYTKIRKHDLLQITADDNTVVAHAISFAVGLVQSYLTPKYDIEKIFTAKGEDREMILISMCEDIAIYEIVSIAQPNIDLTDRRERRNQALDYLKAVRDDNMPTCWPLAQNPTPQENAVEHGGTPSRGNYF